MSPTNNKSLLSILIAIVACLHCNCWPTIDKLEILRIGNIRVDSLTRELITLRAEIEIKNPYYSSAQLRNISFDLSLTDHAVAYGKFAGSTNMKARGTAVLGVPLAVSCKDLSEKDFHALFKDPVAYRIDGSAILEKPFGPRTLPIHVAGSMHRQDELRLLLNQATALDILSPDVSGVTELASLIRKRQLSMRFYNPFGFSIPLGDFQYQMRLGTGILADGRSANPLLLQPGNNRFHVSVQPHPSTLAGNLLDLLIQRKLPDITLESNFTLANGQNGLKVHLIYSPSR